MHEWRSGLDFPFDQPEGDLAPAPALDTDVLVVENLRLRGEVAALDAKLQQATAALQRLSGRLVELERQVRHPPGVAEAIAALHAQVGAAEARAVAAEAARHEAEAERRALEATSAVRWSTSARSLFARARRATGGP